MTLSSNAIEFTRDVSYEEWERVGFELFAVQQAWQWWVGDWINYGERKYGDTYKGAIAVTGRSYKSLANIASLCKSIESSRRRELSFRHHREVQSLPAEQQDELLDQAESEGWSCRQLREQVRLINGDAEPADDQVDSEPEEVDEMTEVLEVFRSTENRVTAMLSMLKELEPHELHLVREWIKTQ